MKSLGDTDLAKESSNAPEALKEKSRRASSGKKTQAPTVPVRVPSESDEGFRRRMEEFMGLGQRTECVVESNA